MTNYYYNQSHIIFFFFAVYVRYINVKNCNYTALPVPGDSIEKGRMTVVEKMSK